MALRMKKWWIFALVVVVLGAGAGIFTYQLSARVEEETRAYIASLPGVQQSSVDSVQYNILEQTLRLKNLRVEYQAGGNDVQLSVGKATVAGPNLKLLQGAADAGTLLAEEVRLEDYAITAPSGRAHVDKAVFVGLHGDLQAMAQVDFMDSSPSALSKLFAALKTYKVGSFRYDGVMADIKLPDVTPLRITSSMVEGKDVSISYIGSYLVRDMTVDLKQLGSFSVGTMEMEAVVIPDLSQFPPELLADPNADPARVQQAMTALLPLKKPVLGALVFRDVQTSFVNQKLSLKHAGIKNLWYDPPQGSFVLEGLSVPATLPSLSGLRLLGYSQAVLAGEVSLKPTENKQMRMVVAMDMENAGTLELSMDLLPPAGLAPEAAQSVDNMLMESLRCSYVDKGLAGRSAKAARQMMGLGPNEILALAAINAQEIAGGNPENTQQFMNFVKTPGEITLLFKPAAPLPLKDLEALASDPTALRVESKPGSKTLQQLVDQ